MESSQTTFVSSMIHEIKASLRGEPHTFNEIRYMMDDARIGEMDFIELLQQHHRFLNESIVVLLDKESMTSEKQMHLERFLRLLDMHAHAEEETLYRSLVRHRDHDVKREGLVGQDEHAIAFQLATELKGMGFESGMSSVSDWTDDVDAKAKVLAGVVAHHIKEEESIMFPLARRSLLPGEFLVLAGDYLDICEFYLDGENRVLAPTVMTWPINP